MDGPSTATEIAQAIASDLGGSAEEHRPHVNRAIADLLREGLLVDDSTPTPMPDTAGGISSAHRSGIAAQLRQHPDARTDVLAIGTCTVALVTFDDELQRFLRSRLGRLVVDSTSAEPDHQLAVVASQRSDLPFRLLIDGVLKHRATSRGELLRQLTFELNVLARTPAAGSTIALHSGAVERSGRVLLIAGPKGAGKSTLTAALVQSGARYVTDEVALVDLPVGRLRPYPKPLDLSADSFRLLGLHSSGGDEADIPVDQEKTSVPVDLLGLASPGGAAVTLLVLDPSAAPTQRVDAVEEKVALLLANSFAEPFQREVPSSLLQPAVDWIGSLVVVRAGRGELASTVELAEALLASE